MKEPITDFLNRPLAVGDFVFYGTTDRYSKFGIVKIDKITDATIFGTWAVCDRKECIGDTTGIRAFNHVIKIFDKEAIAQKLLSS